MLGPVTGEPTSGDLLQRLKAEQRKLEAVRELHRVLGATLDLDHLLVQLLEKMTELLSAERATIYLVTDDRQALVSTVAMGSVPTIRLQLGQGIAGWVAQSGATVNIPDAYADQRFNQAVDRASGFRTRSILCMPVPDHKGQTVGVIQVLNKKADPDGREVVFDKDDEALLGTVAAHAGISIENSKLYLSVVQKNRALLDAQEQLRQRIRELDLLVEIEQEASASLDLDEFLDRLLMRAMQLVDAEAGSVLLRERASGELFFRSAQGVGSESLRRIKLPAGAGIAGWVALHKQPARVEDPQNDARHDLFISEKLGVPARSIMAVPLVHAQSGDGQALGAFELLNKRGGRRFDDGDLKLLTLIAGQAAKAIVLARSREEKLNSDRLASIGQMMSGVLHDLKTPMTIVSGYAQLMAANEDSRSRKRYADLIQKQFDLMSVMTREVLLFARGQSQLLIRRVYLQHFAEDVKQQLEREFAGKKVKLVIDTRYVGAADFDELKMFRVIHNLARNAAQAMDDEGTFRIIIEADGPDLIFTFTDTGKGIPEAIQGRLFEAFTTAGKSDGTGLGLAIVKKIVDEHNGKITYETREGIGTTFKITMPIERPLTT